MWTVIAWLWLAVFATLAVVTALVREVRMLNQAKANDRRDIVVLQRDVATLNIEAGLTVSVNSVHGIPEMNRWPAKPQPPAPPKPKVSLRMRVKARWADFVLWWRKVLSL